ncbi:reverse transcriptase ribonuclease h [Moniliophthora roreri MCA 2997]|uniref:Reverse transcriptase ribonuclease h n=1 Tax=Moniliophthora roreri (strain MCA 2997) TaxID=1381753 RepID=V2W6T3_MONRO|nr:reverse transcriptase ribonuclease h [Moniliophthora roreri MCA 2997]
MELFSKYLRKGLSKKSEEDANRQPVTHNSDARKAYFRGLSLGKKLETNFNIRKNNEEIREKQLLHDENPTQNPAPLQRTASPVSITESELDTLVTSPTVFGRYKHWLPDEFVAKIEKMRSEKKGSAEGDGGDKSEKLSTKTVGMFKKVDVVEVEWQEGINAPITFPEELKFAANFIPIPLGVFSNVNIRKLWAEQKSITPKKRLHPTQPGTHYVWDIEDIASRILLINKDDIFEGLSYSKFLEASFNFLRFAEETNELGKESREYQFIRGHLQFFIDKENAEELYYKWKKEEKTLREDWYSHKVAFNPSRYALVWNRVETLHEAALPVNSPISHPTPSAHCPEHKKTSSHRGVSQPDSVGSSSNSRHHPFRNGSAEAASRSHCLGCGERGHQLWQHTSKHGSIVKVGAFIRDGNLYHPDDTVKPICVTFNTSASVLFDGSADPSHPTPKEFFEFSKPHPLNYHDFSSSIHHRPLLPDSTEEEISISSRIVTPYSAKDFAEELATHNLPSRYPLLVTNLTQGFPIGNMPLLTKSIIEPNHASVDRHFHAVEKYLSEELAAGRMSGPFSLEKVERICRGPVVVSPLIVAVQEQGPGLPAKYRVCRNLSRTFPDHPSVNDFINKEDFPTRFDSASRMVQIVAAAPPGFQGCMVDIEKFHRTCPVLPDHKPFLVVQGRDGKFYLDHCHPFGLASASSNSGMIANAMVDIWLALNTGPISKYEDDIHCGRQPTQTIPKTTPSVPLGPLSSQPAYSLPSLTHNTARVPTELQSLPPTLIAEDNLNYYVYDYDKQIMMDRVQCLRTPWHLLKGDSSFVWISVFIGFLWDLPRKWVSLPEEKRLKYLHRVCSFIDAFSLYPCLLEDVEQLHGTLCHVSFVHQDGQSRLPSMSNFMMTFEGNQGKSLHSPKGMIKDLIWWQEQLSNPHFYCQLQLLPSLKDIGIYIDASTDWGIGVIIDSEWAAFCLVSNWKSLLPGQGICWLETIAVELMLLFLMQKGYQNVRLLVCSDNQGTIGAFAKAHSAHVGINLSICCMFETLNTSSIIPELIYVNTKDNLADPILCRLAGPQDSKLPCKFDLPLELQPILAYV